MVASFSLLIGACFLSSLSLIFRLTNGFITQFPFTGKTLTNGGVTRQSSVKNEEIVFAPVYQKGDIDFSTIKSIISDMDGTLLKHNSELTTRTLQAIQSLQSKGKTFFPATGRNRGSFGKIIDKRFLQLYGSNRRIDQMPGVYSQGLCVYGIEGEIIHEEFLDYSLVQEIEDYINKYSILSIGYSGDRVFTTNWNRYVREFKRYKEPITEFVYGSLTKVEPLKLKLNKIIIFADEPIIQHHRPILEEVFAGKVAFTRGMTGMLELLPFGSSKGKGVLKFLEYYQIDPSEVVAFGDAENDLEMIKLVKYGIAMKNAKEDLFQYAYRRTFHTNEEDGVAEILEDI